MCCSISIGIYRRSVGLLADLGRLVGRSVVFFCRSVGVLVGRSAGFRFLGLSVGRSWSVSRSVCRLLGFVLFFFFFFQFVDKSISRPVSCVSIGRSVGRSGRVLFGWSVFFFSLSVGRLIDRPVSRSVGLLIEVDRFGRFFVFVCRPIIIQSVFFGGLSVDRLVGWLSFDRSISLSTVRSVGQFLMCRLVDRSVGRSVGRLVGRFVGRFVRLSFD